MMYRKKDVRKELLNITQQAITEEQARRKSTLLTVSSISSIISEPSPVHSRQPEVPFLWKGAQEPTSPSPSLRAVDSLSLHQSPMSLHSEPDQDQHLSYSENNRRSLSNDFASYTSPLPSLSLSFGSDQLQYGEPLSYRLLPAKEKRKKMREHTADEVIELAKEDPLFTHCEPIDKIVPISTIRDIPPIVDEVITHSLPSFRLYSSLHNDSHDSATIISKLFLPVYLDGEWQRKLIIITNHFLRVMDKTTGFAIKLQIDLDSLEPPALCHMNQVSIFFVLHNNSHLIQLYSHPEEEVYVLIVNHSMWLSPSFSHFGL